MGLLTSACNFVIFVLVATLSCTHFYPGIQNARDSIHVFFPPTNIEIKKALTSQYNDHQLPEDGIIRNFRIIVPIQYKGKAVTGLEWPRRFQEVKIPRFHDNGTGWW
jgi:hypothetical protein